MTEQPSSRASPEIRDAACVIVIDASAEAPKMLMGRRHADQVFLPDKWVFPGGRVDNGDRKLAARFNGDFTPRDLASDLKPFALAAIRELCEETGLVIGGMPTGADPIGDGWGTFAATGYAPAPASLSPLARAITPPGRVRRYDTWFFTAQRSALADVQAMPDGELLDLDWFTLDRARKLDLPNITRLVLEDVAARLHQGPGIVEKLPFYFADACGFQRTLISCTLVPTTP